MNPLALVTLVFLGPPVLYVLLLTARGRWRRLRRRPLKVSVAELVERIT